MPSKKKHPGTGKLDQLVADSRRSREQRKQGYREQALKLYPWVCGRCGREFTRDNVQQLTVHHRDHDHENNPSDGSNWELLCVYCHDNEHQRQLEAAGQAAGVAGDAQQALATHNPFADLKTLLKGED
jgi:5-methylcytosine-specific restriction endonuclease McrA